MKTSKCLKTVLLGSAFGLGLTTAAFAERFNIPAGDLNAALSTYANTTGAQLVVSADAVRGVKTQGVSGDFSADSALSQILTGTGFIARHKSGASIIVRDQSSSASGIVQDMQLAQAASPPRTTVETVTVTSSKLGGADVQSIPIAITALSQEQLTATQTAGGPDLIKSVPNMTFTKTNFSGYSIQIRGIGTQAISVTTDPAVAVAFNDVPFIRNHFFEQEFFDVASVEILRGPQGTLYGRNATAGVVNLTSAKPTDQFEAMASAELGNYQQRRFEAMLNLPIVDDRLAVRFAGEWTKRKGYSTNELTGEAIDGRNLWSGRATIAWKPSTKVQTTLVWEHFQEDDDRLRSSKQLCKRDPGPSDINGVPVPEVGDVFGFGPSYLSQGCLPASPYSDEAYQVPNGFSLAFYTGPLYNGLVTPGRDPYAGATQSRDLRVIESSLDPIYKARSDTLVFNAEYQAMPALKFISQTGFNNDFLWATQDYNRFNTQPGFFIHAKQSDFNSGASAVRMRAQMFGTEGIFCDPQLGCSDRLVAQDLVSNNAWQLNQEFRVASAFDGPFNFSLGANYMHYETYENYYVFINSLTAFSFAQGGDVNATGELARPPWTPGVSDNSQCLFRYGGFKDWEPENGGGQPNVNACTYIDPNPLDSLNDQGHNYFLSQNPYVLNSWAAFGEAYYDVTDDLKLTGGLRFTRDEKHFPLIPSWLLARGAGYPVAGKVDQDWGEFTGRLNATWSPKLNFTDQTLIYSSYAHGYKAGGANPPGAVLLVFASGQDIANPIHPLTFEPEFIDAFEIGTKNTLLDGALTFNSTAFYYDYKNYQISEIIDRTSINRNFDARVLGAEVEGTWEPMPGLRFNFAGGWEDAKMAKGSRSIDLMDRTGGNEDWLVVKPFATQSSNCIIPKYVAEALLRQQAPGLNIMAGTNKVFACAHAYNQGHDPVTQLPYNEITPTVHGTVPQYNIPASYKGFDPSTAPNNGEGFYKDLSGNELPNAPKFTTLFGAQYSMPVTNDWAATLRGDFYWQDAFWARVFNDDPYDRIRGYSTVNLSLILTSQSGWQAMGFIKNVFNKTAITGTFLNSDDSGLTTNVFLTDPRLIGVRITKNW